MKPLMSLLFLTFLVQSGLSHEIYAQQYINVTENHAKLGRKFADNVWVSSKTGTISLPKSVDLTTGQKGEFIKISFEKPISILSFRSYVNEVVKDHSEITNIEGGWTIENGDSMAYFLLNSKEGSDQDAFCWVLYNHRTGNAIFNTMSSQR